MDTKHDFRKMIIDFVRDNPSHPQLQVLAKSYGSDLSKCTNLLANMSKLVMKKVF